MPELDLKRGEYRLKKRNIYRPRNASRLDLWLATLFGIWAATAWTMAVWYNLSPHPLATVAVAFGPGALWYLWVAVTD